MAKFKASEQLWPMVGENREFCRVLEVCSRPPGKSSVLPRFLMMWPEHLSFNILDLTSLIKLSAHGSHHLFLGSDLIR